MTLKPPLLARGGRSVRMLLVVLSLLVVAPVHAEPPTARCGRYAEMGSFLAEQQRQGATLLVARLRLHTVWPTEAAGESEEVRQFAALIYSMAPLSALEGRVMGLAWCAGGRSQPNRE